MRPKRSVLIGALSLVAFPLAGQESVEERSWLECTGEAHPPASAQIPAHRPIPRVRDSFDSIQVASALRTEAAQLSGEGCALFLMGWTRDRALESHGILESSLPEATVTRIEDVLLDSQVPPVYRYPFFRVLVHLGPEVGLTLGLPWDEPATLVDPAAVADMVDGIFLEGASQRGALLQVLVLMDGPPTSFHITRSSGHPRVDQHLSWLLPSFQFRARRVEGRPFESWISLPVMMPSRQD